MYFKSNTHNFSNSYAQKEGDVPATKIEDENYENINNSIDNFDSTRPFSKPRKTKKSVFYADNAPNELKVHINLDEEDHSFNEIKDRNGSLLTPNIDLSLFDDLDSNNNNGDKKLKVYLRRRYALVKKKTYFSAEGFRGEDEKFSDFIENEIFFNVKNFFIFFFYHFLFHFLFGPLSVLFTFKFSGVAVYRNQFFWGLNPVAFLNYVQYFVYLIVIIIYCSNTKESLKSFNSQVIYMTIPIIFLRICIIALKYATISQEKINMIKYKVLQKGELLQELTFLSWAWQTDSCLERELQATIQRTEIDLAIFKFSFLNENLKKELEQNIKNENKRAGDSPSPAKVKKSKSRVETFEDKIYNYEHQLQNFFDANLSGYSLAKYLLKSIRFETKSNLKFCIYLIIPVTLVRSLLPLMYEYATATSTTVIFTSRDVGILFLSILLNYMFFSLNFLFLVYGIFELDKTYKMLSQLSNLLSPKQTEQYHTTKTLPTINFFCPISLKCWDSLHKVLRNYGAKFRLRVNYYLTIFLIYVIVMLALIIMKVFGVIFLDAKLIIVIVYEVVFFFITLLVIFYKALVINDHYHIHMFLIKKNKNILSDLLNLYAVYFEKEDYVPDNEIYKEGVFRIKSNVTSLINYENMVKSRKNSVFKQKKIEKEEIIKKSIINLINISENIIEELQFYKKYMPFKVLGICVDKQFIESLTAGLFSIFIVIVQKVLKDKNIF